MLFGGKCNVESAVWDENRKLLCGEGELEKDINKKLGKSQERASQLKEWWLWNLRQEMKLKGILDVKLQDFEWSKSQEHRRDGI